MNLKSVRPLFVILLGGAALAAELSIPGRCRADLFAINTNRSIVRLDSTTGALIDSYPIPDFLGPVAAPGSLALSGRTLLWVRTPPLQGFSVLSRFDLLDQTWGPFNQPILPTDPGGNPTIVTGAGIRPGDSGDTLVATDAFAPGNGPTYYHEFFLPLIGFSDDPLVPLFGPVLISSDLAARDADVDPLTGDAWVAVREDVNQLPVNRLLHLNATGGILETITVQTPLALIRGVAFDRGQLFVGVVNLAAGENELLEVDRTTGDVLRTLPLPPGGYLGWTGGEVIPEPSGLLLGTIAGALVGVRRRR